MKNILAQHPEQYAKNCYDFAVELVPELNAWRRSPLLSSSTKRLLFEKKLPMLIREHQCLYRDDFYFHIDELKDRIFTVAINTLDCD